MEEMEIKNYEGVCIVVGARLAPYVQEVERNSLGRFLLVTLRGQQNQETTIIVA